MAFLIDNFDNTSSGAAYGPRVWTYKSATDDLETIAASGYFDSIFQTMSNGDLIYIVATDGEQKRILISERNELPVVTGGYVFSGLVQTSEIVNNAVTEPKLAENIPYTATVAITDVQWKAMNASPVLLVAAPGANKMLRVNSVRYVLDYNAAQYTGGGVVAVQYDSTAAGAGVLASATVANTVFNGYAADSAVGAAGALASGPSANIVNKGLYLSTPTAFTVGNSAVRVYVTYETVSTTV